MTLAIAFDPWRGGYEIRDDEGMLVVAHNAGHGGPRLVGITDPRQLPEGDVTLPFRSTFGETVKIELDGCHLRIEFEQSRLRVRLNQPAKTVTVVHEDFK